VGQFPVTTALNKHSTAIVGCYFLKGKPLKQESKL